MLCEEAEKSRDGIAKGSTIPPEGSCSGPVHVGDKGAGLSREPILRGAFVDGHLLISYFLFSYLLSCIGASGCELGPVW
jgi:hypothetical protein